MIELTRKQILEGNYLYPDNFIVLKPTYHFKERLEERGLDLDIMPTMVRLTENNIASGKSRDGKRLSSVVVKLKYSSVKDLYLAINPFDGGLKSMWFRDSKTKNNGKNNRKNNRQTIRIDRRKDPMETDTG